MNKKQISFLAFCIVCIGSIICTGASIASKTKNGGGNIPAVPEKSVLEGISMVPEDPNVFGFEIRGSKFVRKSDGKEVFLNIIGYQPLEPGKEVWVPWDPEAERINENRIIDDLRRWRAYQGGTDQVVIRVYPGPTENWTSRMPQSFYDGVRNLGFLIIRDIYFGSLDLEAGQQQVEAVMQEVADANALDLIFAWEIGNEFEAPWDGTITGIKSFVEDMCAYINTKLADPNFAGASKWVTWASWVKNDPLRTDGEPILPEGLDYIAYNSYSYEPDRKRDHQAGPTTGTPYQGYLAALKERYPNRPFVISETGLSDSNSPDEGGDHYRYHPWYPAYRKGGLTGEQAAEGLADRYWDARLLSDDDDPNMVIAGMAVFEWNDEWHKAGNPNSQADHPEEHFGLGRFVEEPNRAGYQLRYKLQQETIRDLYTLRFDEEVSVIKSLTADSNSLPVGGSTTVHAELCDGAVHPVRLRWESNRGHIVGDSENVKFYTGDVWLGPAVITLVAIDADGNVGRKSIRISINTNEDPSIEILTLGPGKETGGASGRVYNVDLDKNKLVVYIETNYMYVQPDLSMKSIWIRPDGYWWTKVVNDYDGDLICWLVPSSYVPTNLPPGSDPPENTIATGTLTIANDNDNDLLPDAWEVQYFGAIEPNDRYDDHDMDLANNLEEFLAGTSPLDDSDNDSDGDNLPDNWEKIFFGTTELYDDANDPDGDDLKNFEELDLGLHPGRSAADTDRDGLPDLWEIRLFGNYDMDADENPDGDCHGNLEEYELGLDPTRGEGDMDCDYGVNYRDFALLSMHWLEERNDLNWCDKVDLNRDGEASLPDLRIMAGNWLMDP